MKVIILSAGQGKRLYPHTLDRPKCLVPVVDGCTLLDWQLRQLAAAGLRDVVIVTGFGADQVEKDILRHSDAMSVRTLFNPEYASADNLASAALSAPEMGDAFIILNGDTLFTSSVVAGLCAAPEAPVTVSIAWKDSFDSDDMKAIVRAGKLAAVSKTLKASEANAESIGMIRFLGEGVAWFCEALKAVSAEGDAARKYYLSAVDMIAHERGVGIYEVPQDSWAEVDVPEDLERARRCVERWTVSPAVVRNAVSDGEHPVAPLLPGIPSNGILARAQPRAL